MLGFNMVEDETGAIVESIRQSAQKQRGLGQSVHAPAGTRSEPPRRRAPSQATTSSPAITRSKGRIRLVPDANIGAAQKRARDEAYTYDDQEVTLLDSPSLSAPAASASEYPSALGKENTIFKGNAPRYNTVRTPGPRGKNKRTLDDQVSFTKSASSVRFTSRADLQEERRTRQFTKKIMATPTANE
ncbi:hypothetical protein Pdw03_1242 [Penicillium digitatum]|uniref:Uncharacterized protein n=1 Tax=Penicillium digitatum TaxID=36651 RepID=A0A7T6XSC6_PENDI|nr:hypothetical protein Pdw03_1242 [Penicillium digitatum]